jgi:hypothetical protein
MLAVAPALTALGAILGLAMLAGIAGICWLGCRDRVRPERPKPASEVL